MSVFIDFLGEGVVGDREEYWGGDVFWEVDFCGSCAVGLLVGLQLEAIPGDNISNSYSYFAASDGSLSGDGDGYFWVLIVHGERRVDSNESVVPWGGGVPGASLSWKGIVEIALQNTIHAGRR